MRIPLDYYRILGVPIQADKELLSQAYNDRTLQIPRREYSRHAIAARKKLLAEAYEILSEPEKRAEYNVRFLERTYSLEEDRKQCLQPDITADLIDDGTPWIEINPDLFVGVLVILHELGEYELVLRLGGPYSRSLEKNQRGIRADIILTLALSYLELGREQWQENQYENAAISGQMGLDLLLREQLFPSIREEIQIDLCKLRPYLILELLSEQPKNLQNRNKGQQLLREMLDDRGGIEGTLDDRSGLSVDEFLRFIQQIRTYLSSKEQQELFEAEAQRPSGVAAYLAVYALLARGFAEKKPSHIVHANAILTDLEQRQEVYLEQAVCYLLLGQTETANRALEQSQEMQPLAFIREHSQGSPDLLPGLCLYAQRWLTTEVFSHFYDLAETKISLDDYFSDRDVQAYLESLSDEIEVKSKGNISKPLKPVKAKAKAKNKNPTKPQQTRQPKPAASARENPAKQLQLAYKNIRSRLTSQTSERKVATEKKPVVTATKNFAKPAIAFSEIRFTPVTNLGQLPQPTNNIPQNPPDRSQKTTPKAPTSAKASQIITGSKQKIVNKLLLSWKNVMTNISSRSVKAGVRPRRKSSLKIERVLLLALPLFLGFGILAFTYQRSLLDSSSISILEEESPVESFDTATSLESESTEAVFAEETLNEETARGVIETWLESKSLAFGIDRKIDSLDTILAEPLLSRQRSSAVFFQQNNVHRMFSHAVQVQSVQNSPEKPEIANVEARVREVASHYQNGQYNPASSYDENLLVRYHLIRQDDRWLINDINVLQ